MDYSETQARFMEVSSVGLQKNFQVKDLAEVLDLLLVMVRTVADGLQPHKSDVGRAIELIAEIRASRTVAPFQEGSLR